jgi:hypothetical protein
MRFTPWRSSSLQPWPLKVRDCDLTFRISLFEQRCQWDPIPANLWGILLLGYEYETKFVPWA